MDIEGIKQVLTNWDVGNLISYKQAEKGVVNFNYILNTSSGKYILRKIGPKKNLKELKFELNYVDYLKKAKFSYNLPYPIKTKSKGLFVKKGKGIFWLYNYIEGENIPRFDKPELKEIAKMMAEYHTIIEKSELDNHQHYSEFAKEEILEEINFFREKITNKIQKEEKEKIFLEESDKLIPLLDKLNAKEYAKLPKYPLHRDINQENTLWNKGKLTGLIDFENVSEIKDTIIKDIAGMLQYSCRDKKIKYKTDLNLARFFIKEYRKYHELSDKEIGFIPDIITAGGVEDFGYSYWMLVNDTKRAKLYRLKLYSKVAQWHHSNKNKIIREISK